MNGRLWILLDEASKRYFVPGFTEATLLENLATYAEMCKGVDQFYMDPANAQVPIWQAMVVFGMKVKGSTPTEIETTMARLRIRI